MKGVILAAGKGTRFGSEKPKILARLLDKSLLEHAVTGLIKAGIPEEDIVVIYSDNRVCEVLQGFPRISLVYNEAVERGNGYSLLKAKPHVGEDRFILVMGDHYLEADCIKSLLSSTDGDHQNGKIHLAVEKNLDRKNVEEATKVLLDKDRIADIGKKIKHYNALDTGLFLCSPKIFEIAESFEGSFSVNDVMKKASQRGILFGWDIGDSRWVDIDTKEDLKLAERMILDSLTKESDGIISRHFNRKVSTRLTKLLLKTGVTPNQISLMSFILALASGGLFFLFYPIAGGILAQISSIVDGCDGELARLRGLTSRFGAFYDSVLDRYADFAILLGMIMANPAEYWLPGAFALLGSLSISYTTSRAELLTGKGFTSGFNKLMTRDMRLFIIMLGGIFNQILPTLYVLAVGTNIVVFSRMASVASRVKRGGGQTHLQY